MSLTPVEVVTVSEVLPHPNADRLEIVKVLATQFVAPKGSLCAGDFVLYFPPDVLIPETVAGKLGVANYLKHATYPGDLMKSQCRIGAIRLRGVASFGFGLPLTEVLCSLPSVAVAMDGQYPFDGLDLSEAVSAVKYQPPQLELLRGGDSMRQPGAFHTYTDIQHYYRNAQALMEGTPVRITEKIHGTNSRVGLVKDDGLEFMCGTHHRRVKQENAKGRLSSYWRPLTDDMKKMLRDLSGAKERDAIVFGEIYGPKIQSMDYGLAEKSYAVFDISIDGEYLNWEDVKRACDDWGIRTVPLLYEGPFSVAVLEQLISGPTVLAKEEDIRCKFKGREGVVITPLEETYSPVMGGRLILKAVSPDYYEAMN